jgi:transcriptional regulator with XRE-family HTH domain
MEKNNAISSDTTRHDFVAFEAGVRQRLAQRSTLSPDRLHGVERLGRLVHVLRLKQHWSLEALAVRAGLPWLWLALLEQGVLLPTELTPERVTKLGQVFPLHQEGPDPVVLFRSLVEDLADLRLEDQETLAPSAEPAALPIFQEAEDIRGPQEKGHLASPRSRIPTATLRAASRWFGRSAEPVSDIGYTYQERIVAGTVADVPRQPPRYYLSHTADKLVTASVRISDDAPMEVAIETQSPECAARQWEFLFTGEDGTELYRGTMTLQPSPEQPGLWEGRVAVDEGIGTMWRFAFQALFNDGGDLS